MFSKLYVMTERDIIKFFQRYPEYLETKQFELIYKELLAHTEEIRHSTYEPFVRKRYPLTQRLYFPSVPITGFMGTTTDI